MSGLFSSYKKTFSNVLVFFLLCLACIGASFAVSFPFFYLATLHKGIYTTMCTSLFSLSFFFFAVRKMVKTYKTAPRRLFSFFVNLSIVLSGVFSFIFLAINMYRVLAMVSLAVAVILYVLFAPLLSRWAHG